MWEHRSVWLNSIAAPPPRAEDSATAARGTGKIGGLINSPWIYTMPRCLSMALATMALAMPVLASAQIARALPLNSLRGEVTFGQPPEVTLNGTAMRLAPGARIRDTNNMLVLSGTLAGQKLKVNYTLDPYGLLFNVWVLRSDEIARLWPTTAEEAAKWTFNPLTSTWTKS